MADDKKKKIEQNIEEEEPQYGFPEVTGNETVDIDSILVNVLLIVKNKSQFNSVALFLQRRGWGCTVVTSMNDAIRILAKEKPQFVLISFNHPNPKLTRLPVLLTQTFDTNCIGFCETPDLRTESRLTASKMPYKLVGAASGPSIHRRIKQIMASMYGQLDGDGKITNTKSTRTNKQNEKGEYRFSQSEDEKAKKGPKVRMFTADKEVKSNNTGYMKFSKDASPTTDISTAELVMKLQSALSDEDLLDTGKPDSAANQVKKNQAQNLEKDPFFTQIDKKDNGDEGSISEDGVKTKSHLNLQKGDKTKSHLDLQKGDKTKSHLDLQKGDKTKSHLDLQKGDKSNKDFELNKQNENDKENLSSTKKTNFSLKEENISEKKGASKQEDLDLSSKEYKILATQNLFAEEKSYLYKAVVKALEIVNPSPHHPDFDISLAKKMGVLPVKSEDFNGYLTFISNVKEQFDEDYMMLVKAELNKILVDEGHKVNLQEGFLVEIIDVDIRSWKKNCARFYFNRELGEGEILVSFMESEYEVPIVTQDLTRPMTAVDPKQFFPGRELEFNAYIFMDKSDRYFLYTKDGRYISSKQQEKLLQKDVNIFIAPKDLGAFRHYFAKNVLNDLIDYYLKSDVNKKKMG